jgi:hypothetical protein
MVTQRTVTESLKKSLLTDNVIMDELDENELFDAIDNWWKAWKEICPEGFDTSTRARYTFFKHVPFRVLTQLLATTLRWFLPMKKPLTKDNFRSVIENMRDANYAEYWKVGARASQFRGDPSGVRELLRELDPLLMEALRKVRVK